MDEINGDVQLLKWHWNYLVWSHTLFVQVDEVTKSRMNIHIVGYSLDTRVKLFKTAESNQLWVSKYNPVELKVQFLRKADEMKEFDEF